MEKGELILRVHEESLILNVYKPMNHHGIRSNLKIDSKELTMQDPPDKPLQAQPLYKTVNEDPNPSLNKVEIKRNKSGVAQASYTDKSTDSNSIKSPVSSYKCLSQQAKTHSRC
ncbi:hypothetical protein PIB30_098991 [Stylosanthes scabra]|uniref:Uncharacterized protein n=1 Tax=Stylosanthes scabra TaxID=79078 RepID=A0ABU6WWN4_9FABA|nr:hypothetical protein [Stylosanthes scabra]